MSGSMRARGLLALVRPSHWVKNAFVLAGIFFAGDFLNASLLIQVLWTFLAFCLASSAVYAFNDTLDREADRLHPRKRTRPVASGTVSVSTARVVASLCGVSSLLLAWTISLRLLLLIACYGIVNAAYSRLLKHVVLLDVFCIAAGFLLRLLAGTWGVDIPPSQWFMLCTFLLSLFLGFSKRYAERMDENQKAAHKRAVVVEAYSPEFLRILLGVTLACTLMAYGLYTLSPETLAVHGTGKLIYTLPFAAFILFRYLYLVMARGFGENLAGELAKDASLGVSVGAYLVVTGFLLF